MSCPIRASTSHSNSCVPRTHFDLSTSMKPLWGSNAFVVHPRCRAGDSIGAEVESNKQKGAAGRRGCLCRCSGMEGPVGGTPEAVVQGAFDALRQWHGMKKENRTLAGSRDAQHASHAAGKKRKMPAAPPDSGVFDPGGGFRRCPLPPSAGHRLRTGGSIRREASGKRPLFFTDTDSFAPKSHRQTLFAAAPRSWMADRLSRTVTSCSGW